MEKKIYCDCEVGTCQGGTIERCVFEQNRKKAMINPPNLDDVMEEKLNPMGLMGNAFIGATSPKVKLKVNYDQRPTRGNQSPSFEGNELNFKESNAQTQNKMGNIDELANEYMSKAKIIWTYRQCFVDGYNKANEWISVDDRLPEMHESVLAVDIHGDMSIWSIVFQSKVKFWDCDEHRVTVESNHITHWQFLPIPPTKN